MRPDGEERGGLRGSASYTALPCSEPPSNPPALGLGGRRGHTRRPRELAGAVGEGATPCTDGRPSENNASVARVTPILATQRGQRISTSRTSRTSLTRKRNRRRANLNAPMASHRIGARVAGLSPAQLCAIIEAQAGASDAALRVAEEHAARLVEQPEWVLSEVLLSPDLAPHILAQLPTTEHAAKGTCRAWRRGWKETLKKRERPRLFVFGGHDSDGEFLNSLERYDPSTNEWEEEAVAPMPTARLSVLVWRCSMASSMRRAARVRLTSQFPAWWSGTTLKRKRGRLWRRWRRHARITPSRCSTARSMLLAGSAGGVGRLSSVERYDPATNAWEAVAPMASARRWNALAVLDGKLYAVGGVCNGGALSLVERYDPALDAWEAVAPMDSARQEHAVAVLDGKLYAVGGYSGGDGSYLSSVERYDPTTNAWEAVAPLAASRAAVSLAVLDGKLYRRGRRD